MTVLPLPDAGAARIRPGAVMVLIAGPAGQRADPVQRRAQQHHVADHDKGRRLDPVGRHVVGAPLQRGFQHVLVGQGGVGDDGDRLRQPAGRR